jgi:ATP-binding cassette subfamily B protein
MTVGRQRARSPSGTPDRVPLRARLRGSFEHTPRTLALVWRSSPHGTALIGALTLVAAGVPLGIAWVGKAITDAVVARSLADTLQWVLVELALVCIQSLVMRSLALARQLLGLRLSVDINLLILDKALTLELTQFENPAFYDQLTRARREASSRPLSVVSESFQLLQNVLTLAGYIVLLVQFSGWAVLGLLLAAVPATLAEVRFSRAAFKLRNWRSQESRQLNYLEYVLANDEHAKEVKLFGIGPVLLDRFRKLGKSFYEEDKKLAVRRTGWTWVLSLLATGAFYASYAAMALATAAGQLTLGQMVLYVMAFRQGQQAFQSILGALGGMYEHNLYMSNLFDYLAIPTEPSPSGDRPVAALAPENGTAALAAPPAAATNGQAPVPEPRSRGAAIAFEDVGFRYPGNEAWALRHIDVRIAPGESLALVGHNGAGKTTFIKLLTALYQPSEGRILVDGRDVRDWDKDALRRRIGVVFQDFNQYQLALRENVGLGSVDHLGDEPRIDRAVERGGATELVRGLDGGLDAQLGRWFEKGVELSGGQWQKIALARAFMREEADILVLDEPTAALDAEAEQAVFERFRALSDGRTTILISHRFPTVRRADHIVVLEGGHIVEEGTHQSLLAKDARYAGLFKLQAQGYL